jgi:hypothetical protein
MARIDFKIESLERPRPPREVDDLPPRPTGRDPPRAISGCSVRIEYSAATPLAARVL